MPQANAGPRAGVRAFPRGHQLGGSAARRLGGSAIGQIRPVFPTATQATPFQTPAGVFAGTWSKCAHRQPNRQETCPGGRRSRVRARFRGRRGLLGNPPEQNAPERAAGPAPLMDLVRTVARGNIEAARRPGRRRRRRRPPGPTGGRPRPTRARPRAGPRERRCHAGGREAACPGRAPAPAWPCRAR